MWELVRQARVVRTRFRLRSEILYAAVNPWIPERRPDFLCIGAPRTGSTWLYTTLKRHPDVFLPSAKELHFFDEPIEMEWHGKIRDINVCHYGKYFDLDNPAHWRWYSLQFSGADSHQIVGDITPGYCRLSDPRIRSVAEHLGEVKIIFVLRDPVERAWSGVRNFALRRMHKCLDQAALDEIMEFAMQPRRLMGGHYREIINSWERHFGKERILCLFYDDLVSDPESHVGSVCRFLGIAPERIRDRSTMGERVNAADQKLDIPQAVRKALVDHYHARLNSWKRNSAVI